MDNNVYVLRCKQTGEAVLLDAANEHDKLLDLCRRLGVRQVLETHGHWDHIQAVPAVRDAGYEVGVTAADASMLPSYDFVLEDGSAIQVGRLRLHTILTPGHTTGLDVLPAGRVAGAVQRRHPLPRRARAPPSSPVATFRPSSGRSRIASSPPSRRTRW